MFTAYMLGCIQFLITKTVIHKAVSLNPYPVSSGCDTYLQMNRLSVIVVEDALENKNTKPPNLRVKPTA